MKNFCLIIFKNYNYANLNNKTFMLTEIIGYNVLKNLWINLCLELFIVNHIVRQQRIEDQNLKKNILIDYIISIRNQCKFSIIKK